MERAHQLFIRAMQAALKDDVVDWQEQVSASELTQVLQVAQDHHVLPMIFEAVYGCPAAAALEPEWYAACKRARCSPLWRRR